MKCVSSFHAAGACIDGLASQTDEPSILDGLRKATSRIVP